MICEPQNELVIESDHLKFGFNNKKEILKDITLKVGKGEIYGFIGPNGAGKTTTIRLLLGLLNDSENCIRLFGKKLSEDRTGVLSRIGSLIEQPSLYENISGYDNLEIARSIRKLNKSRVKEILELVKLSNAAKKNVRDYSLGMKQRLGLAIALIGAPELLILDEPVNGMDPNGIVEIRELLLNLNKMYGTTIFISSHLLSEMEKIVTHIGIINMGELLFQGRISDLQKLQTGQSELFLVTGNNKAALELLKQRWTVHENDKSLLIKFQSNGQIAQIIRDLVSHEIDVYQVFVEDMTLEKLFLQMTNNYVVG